jgi:prepilin-type N-terminal cleavage/methylation domain-containing protein
MIAGDCSAPFVVEEETEMKNEQGFTVIELLIVMVIVGICLVLGLAVGYGGHKVYQHYNQPTSTQRLN